MKDKNGIEICCENCDVNAQRDCNLWNAERGKVGSNGCREYFYPSYKAYEARIKELQDELYADKYNYESWEEIKEEHHKLEATILKLQKELNIVQESERAEAQEADRLREEVNELGKKLTETIKLLGERSRECGKLQALLEIKKQVRYIDAIDRCRRRVEKRRKFDRKRGDMSKGLKECATIGKTNLL